jgi:hypothetical protein
MNNGIAIALIVGAMTVGIGATAFFFIVIFKWGPRPTPGPARLVKISVPTFGNPREAIFHPDNYDTGLQCTNSECGHHQFQQGERFYEIPLINQGAGAVLAVCVPCATSNFSPKGP